MWWACSDGVTVDQTPPEAAAVHIGPFGSEGTAFSTDCSELSIIWGHFVDLEEQV